MTVTLAFEASADTCSVSLRLASSETKTLRSQQARAHAAYLLPFAHQLLAESNITLSEVDAIACAVGPGSFTGLRIAVGVAQGLAYSADKMIIPVNSLAALAFAAKAPPGGTLIPLMDARMSEVYWGVYDNAGQALSKAQAAMLGSCQSFAQALGPDTRSFIPVGEAWTQVDYAAQCLSDLSDHRFLDTTVDAGHVADLAVQQLAEALPPHLVDLCYCRNSVAWNKRARIRS
ncbi:MAG TPA: tRNA (adenosine(37)-N6)-threonylcarbamoyltransferase complex dimerization subunit type 1 TsaB [Marinagarivorans sp.]